MSYSRKLLDLNEKEFRQLLEVTIESKLGEMLEPYLPYFKAVQNTVLMDEQLLDTNDACKVLNVSRQTLNNWYKKQPTKDILDGTMIKQMGKNKYRIVAIKKAIETNMGYFPTVPINRNESRLHDFFLS